MEPFYRWFFIRDRERSLHTAERQTHLDKSDKKVEVLTKSL